MQLKTTTDYAIRILVYLADRRGGIASSAELARAMGIPQKYLLRVGGVLRDAGYLTAHAGVRGGYSLAVPARSIRLGDVVELMEGTVKLNRCLEEDGYCSRGGTRHCPVHQCYQVMQEKWENFLYGLTIEEMTTGLERSAVEGRIHRRRGRAERPRV